MKKFLSLVMAASLLITTSCASMSRSQKVALGATVAVGVIATLIIVGSKNKKNHHKHRHHHDCDCHECRH